MVSRDLCPSRPNTGGTYIYPYYFHRGKVLTSRLTLVGKLLLLPWLVYREYPPGAGRSPFTRQRIRIGMCGCRYRACGCDVTAGWARGKFSVTAACAFGLIPRLRGPPDSHCFHSCGIKEPVQGPLMLFAPYRVLTRLKVEEIPFKRVRPAGPQLGKVCL